MPEKLRVFFTCFVHRERPSKLAETNNEYKNVRLGLGWTFGKTKDNKYTKFGRIQNHSLRLFTVCVNANCLSLEPTETVGSPLRLLPAVSAVFVFFAVPGSTPPVPDENVNLKRTYPLMTNPFRGEGRFRREKRKKKGKIK